MSRTIYIIIAIFTIAAFVFAGNNFYQARKVKTAVQETSAPAARTPASVIKSQTALPEKPAQPVLAVVNISGFDCPTCPTIAENALKDAKGVLDAKTTTTGEGSRVLYDAGTTNIEEISKVLPPQYSLKVISQKPSQTDKID